MGLPATHQPLAMRNRPHEPRARMLTNTESATFYGLHMTDEQRVGDKNLADAGGQPQARPNAGRSKNAATGARAIALARNHTKEKEKLLTPNARSKRRRRQTLQLAQKQRTGVRLTELLGAFFNMVIGHCDCQWAHLLYKTDHL
jgi:hypothetical protein